MFGLFKKKEKPAAEKPAQENTGELNHILNEKYGPFTGETVELNAITGAIPFGVKPEDAEANPNGPWPALLGLTAWYEDDGPTEQGKAVLVAAADPRLLAHLRRLAPRDCMIQVKARKSERANTYLMLDLPNPVMDAALKPLLLKQLEPITITPEGLGEFTLDRTSNTFQGDLNWLEDEVIQFSFPNCEEEQKQTIFAAARALSARAAEWNALVLKQAALQTDEEVSLTAVDLTEEGEMTFWLGNEDDPEAVCLRATPDGGFLSVEE